MTTFTTVTGNDLFHTFTILTKYVPQVALEMMSKAGEAVKKEQRRALASSREVHTVTSVDRYGRRSLKRSKTPLAFGHRESNNKTSSPKNMQSFINSFLMEEKMVLVVNGTHPTFHPVYRRDGEIVRVGGKVKGVGRATHAILQRMNDDRIDKYYPDESRLYSKNIGTRYAQKGIRRAKPKVMNYLIYAYGEALKRIERKNSKQKTVIYA